MRHFLLYAVIRLGLWVLIWWLLTLFDVGVMLAGVLAALIAMLISILFLDRLRDAAAMRWKAADERRADRRGPDADEDAEYEDAMLDGVEAGDQDGPEQSGLEIAPADAGSEDGPADPAQLPGLDEHGPEEPGPDGSGLEEPGLEGPGLEEPGVEGPDQVRGSDR